MRHRALAPVFACLLVLAAAAPVGADGAWLDGPLQTWNVPGQAVPPVPAGYNVDPMCAAGERLPDTPVDEAVSNAGWRLYGAYQGGWDIVLVTAAAGYDGMCRPMGYQVFAFVDGRYAGTVSPDVMHSRTDGAGQILGFYGPQSIVMSYVRYLAGDPLCCPGGASVLVYFGVQHTEAGPVLAPTQKFNQG